MNVNQIQSLVRALLLAFGTLIVNKGITDSATWTTVVGFIVGLIPIVWSQIFHASSGSPAPQSQGKLNCLLPFALLAIGVIALSGCTTAVKNGDVVGVQSRVFGINIAATASTSTPTPAIQLGLISQTIWMIPSSTNQLYSPPLAATLKVDQSAWNPFSWDWDENIGVQNMQTWDGTNVTSQPIVPKLKAP